MGRPPLTPFEADLAEFFGETGEPGAPARDHVTFRAVEPTTPLEAAEDLVRHIRAQNKTRAHLSRDTRISARTHTSYSGAVTVRVSSQGQRFHAIKFAAIDGGELLASHRVAGGRELSQIVHEWLTTSDRFGVPCWRTANEWARGEPGRRAPA